MPEVIRITVTADNPQPWHEVRISPGRGLLLVFDSSVRHESILMEGRERFRQVSLSEDGLLLALMPSGELPLGMRLGLRVGFADGAMPASMDFILVVHPQSETQVEVYRHPRSGDSYRREAEEAQAQLRQCQTALTREQMECNQPQGLLGLLASNQMGRDGVLSRRVLRDLALRQGEAFELEDAFTYRAPGGKKSAPLTRLAVEVFLKNQGDTPWTPVSAQLVGSNGTWTPTVWPPTPLLPGQGQRILVEVELAGHAAPGPYVLKLWDEAGGRMATLSGVTFP